MKGKGSIFLLELHRFLNKYRYHLIILAVLLLAFAQVEFLAYKHEVADMTASQAEAEAQKGKIQVTAGDDAEVLLETVPAPTRFLGYHCKGSLFAVVRPGGALKLSYRDKHLLSIRSLSTMEFSGLYCIGLTLLCLLMGYDVPGNIRLLKFMSTVTNRTGGGVLIRVLLSRLTFIWGYLTLLVSSVTALAAINGLPGLGFENMAVFLGVSFLLAAFCMLLGGAVRAWMRSASAANWALMIVFTFFYLVYPWAIGRIPETVVYKAAEPKASQQQEIKKIMAGVKDETRCELLRKLEADKRECLVSKGRDYGKLACLLPTSFFMVTAQELSGYGVNNYRLFARYATRVEASLKHYTAAISKKGAKRSAKKSAVPAVLAPTFMESKDLFLSTANLPRHFHAGVGVMLLWCIGLGFLMFRGCKRRIYPAKIRAVNEDRFNVVVEAGNVTVWLNEDVSLRPKFYNCITGIEEAKGELELKIDGEYSNIKDGPVLYIPRTAFFRNVDVNTLHRFLLGIPAGGDMKKSEVLLQYALNSDTFILFDDFTNDLSFDQLKELQCHAKNKELTVMVVTADHLAAVALTETPEQRIVHPGDAVASQKLTTAPYFKKVK